MTKLELLDRLHQHTREWDVMVEETRETETSVIAFGTRADRPVVLKLVKDPGDEWHSGEVLQAFGEGVARVYEHVPGAVLMERLTPGNSLVEMALNGQDEEATDILTDVIQRMSARTSSMSPRDLPKQCPTVFDWAKGFDRYLASGDNQIPIALVNVGRRVYADLCATQRQTRLLHGDLQHYNVLFDADRGWLAIDPKGVIGELEYEIGAALRNPCERPELFLSPTTIERRLQQFSNNLNFDYQRMLAWGFAQAVLSAIWDVEDGFAVDAMHSSVRLAEVLQPMLV